METWNQNKKLIEAVDYFRNPGLKRLMKGLKGRYTSLNRLGGTIRLSNLSEHEAQALEGLLQKSCCDRTSLVISVKQLENALKKTKYSDVKLEEIVSMYYDGDMTTNQELQEKESKERLLMYERIYEEFKGTKAGEWFHSVYINHLVPASAFHQDYKSNREWFASNMPVILSALNQLPINQNQHIRIAVFAAKVSGNPHFFDEGRSLYYLLHGISNLCFLPLASNSNTQEKTELLYAGGIMKDDLSNWVLCYGIGGIDWNGCNHSGMEDYRNKQEAQILTVQNLSQLKGVILPGKDVYVVENPAVFAHMMEKKPEKMAYICSNGQLRLAVLLLLDLVVANGAILWYSGDFDPEGLCIAQKLKSRYGKSLQWFQYTKEVYRCAKSKEPITEQRLKQLEGLEDDKLIEIAQLLRESRCAGYQENALEYYVPK